MNIPLFDALVVSRTVVVVSNGLESVVVASNAGVLTALPSIKDCTLPSISKIKQFNKHTPCLL
jgi:hypothetical protein